MKSALVQLALAKQHKELWLHVQTKRERETSSLWLVTVRTAELDCHVDQNVQWTIVMLLPDASGVLLQIRIASENWDTSVAALIIMPFPNAR